MTSDATSNKTAATLYFNRPGFLTLPDGPPYKVRERGLANEGYPRCSFSKLSLNSGDTCVSVTEWEQDANGEATGRGYRAGRRILQKFAEHALDVNRWTMLSTSLRASTEHRGALVSGVGPWTQPDGLPGAPESAYFVELLNVKGKVNRLLRADTAELERAGLWLTEAERADTWFYDSHLQAYVSLTQLSRPIAGVFACRFADASGLPVYL
jgi:hypothetical protein